MNPKIVSYIPSCFVVIVISWLCAHASLENAKVVSEAEALKNHITTELGKLIGAVNNKKCEAETLRIDALTKQLTQNNQTCMTKFSEYDTKIKKQDIETTALKQKVATTEL